MITLSPGLASGCFELLAMAQRHRMPFKRMRTELPRYERIDVARLLEVSQQLAWLRANDAGLAVLTPRGERILAATTDPLRLRQALLDYVESVTPPWLKLAIDGRKKVLSFAPNDIRQCLVEAELAVSYEAHVVRFWDELASTARGLRSTELNEIGREGERLTLAYEKARTGREPKWRSVESNSDGYDVLSVADRDDSRAIQIEVKTSRAGASGSMHITRNEWDITELMPLHRFHLWDISKQHPLLAVVPRSALSPHVPTDLGSGRWEVLELPFATFGSLFQPVANYVWSPYDAPVTQTN